MKCSFKTNNFLRPIFNRAFVCSFVYWQLGITGIQSQNAITPALSKLQIVESAITNLYVDKVDEAKLVEETITKMLSQLDPHSTYLNPEEVKRMNEPLIGNFEGIGVQFNMVEDTLYVIQPINNGPSERVGILAGDRIIAINDTVIAGVKMSNEKIMSRLRGPKGTEVNLTIIRKGVNEPLAFIVKRNKIPLYSINAFYMIQPKIGYIRIEHFGTTTVNEFREALTKLQKEGMKDLILDLQENGGGYLNAAIDITNEFLAQKELIVYTEGRAANRSESLSKGDGKFQKGRIVLLVNEHTASASEIVSGAIQDWDRGVIVGRRSFGKGLVQYPMNLPDGSMVRLTIARYYTPVGRCIQKPYENIEQYHTDIYNRYSRGEMVSVDSIHFLDSLQYKTKKLGRIIYGGGGIMPDYFVPIDTTFYTDYYRKLRDKGTIIKTAVKYVDNYRNELLKRYEKFEAFNKQFFINDFDLLLADMKELAEKEKIEFNEKEYAVSLPFIKTQLKAFIARDIWGADNYYQIINTTNKSVTCAVEILNSGEYKKILSSGNTH
ncbi:Carboxy-terminal processing protease CtpB [termite gut metagenome]|uniref:Carboxy-terminal processing protease CtpB n=1 Tax=termite gut metagenome TaxID=433724 RepID=A0A5J4S1E3_9ZZZZ